MEDLADILALERDGNPPPERLLRIYTEACRLFTLHGFDGTSMRDIAAECGISKATLYHYFVDKDAIVRPLVLGSTRAIYEHVAARTDMAAAPSEQLRTLMVETAVFFERFRWAWIASAALFWNDPQERHRQARIAWRDRYEGLLRDMLAQAMARGEIRRMDVAVAGRLVLGALNWLPRWYDPAGPLKAPQIAAMFYDMVMAGFRKQA